MTGLIPLATHGSVTLYERAGRSTAPWRSLKLVRHGGKARKKNWWAGLERRAAGAQS